MHLEITSGYQDRKKWDEFVHKASTGHVLQTWEYGEVRDAMDVTVIRIAVVEEGAIKATAQMSLHKIPNLPFYVGYIPRGPVCDENPEKYLPELFRYFKKIARKYNLAFIKVEPNVSLSQHEKEVWIKQLARFGTKSQNPRFMNATSLIDLTRTEEQLLQQCRKNTRYAIRKSQREGFTILEDNSAHGIDTFYTLLSETAARQNFQLASRPKKYFELLFEHFGADAHLFFAYINDEPVATVFNLYAGTTAYYPYGASSVNAHGTSATEGLMWHSIMTAKSAGMATHDLWGVLAKEDTKHPYWGYTFFKNGFGGELLEYIGSCDLPFTKLYYPLQIAETIRKNILHFNN